MRGRESEGEGLELEREGGREGDIRSGDRASHEHTAVKDADVLVSPSRRKQVGRLQIRAERAEGEIAYV